ncbi:L-alanine-DL-glutamate epimerase [Aquiflexum balticum DSM 16537]|uniref:glucarate dehydratase n=1 Tax=Aquiflexum balticum DSM 16537 TaxID=758820 RepID=A0A1W2H8I1_9BACT|nr:mandelate racemase/muconate lactonizing enzyme family protein [Aquiflexum balticum]SMD45169.1 L-alanine-DL-glutamate epimerase [Aquiflexum balticum DSM 16537]
MKRREFISKSAVLGLIPSINPRKAFAEAIDRENGNTYPSSILDIQSVIKSLIIIQKIEILESVGNRFIVVTSKDGLQGITVLNFRMEYLLPILQGMIQPFFIGKDARDIEQILDTIAHDRAVYKYSGIPLFNCIGQVEIAVMDLLGKAAGIPASDFFGKRIRTEIHMYVSSLTRETSPEEEVANLQKQIAETGAKAVKIKVGGRMSRNADAAPGRSENLIRLLRKTFGDGLTIYADANSSFDLQEGLKMATFLEEYGVSIFEEPCYWEDYNSNQKIASSLKTMKLAGGEQDTSYLRWRDIAQNKVYHVLQPDLYYNGGLTRAFYVEKLAIANGLSIAPHSPKDDPLAAPFFQFASVSPILEGYQEFPGGKKKYPDWYYPHFDIKNGFIKVPTGPGLGLEYDDSVFKNAKIINS